MLEQGKRLGIYTWMLYAPGGTDKILALARKYPECAFVISHSSVCRFVLRGKPSAAQK